MRRVGVGCLVLLTCWLAAPGMGHAVIPEGPRLAVLKWGASPQRFELLTMGPDGSDLSTVTGRGTKVRPIPHPNGGLSWAPDGSRIAFVGIVGGLSDFEPSKTRVFLVSLDGSRPIEVPGTEGALSPVLSPDGHTLAFLRTKLTVGPTGPESEGILYESRSIWLADLRGGPPRQLTPWRNHLSNYPHSFSPDGSMLAVSRHIGDDRRDAVAISVNGQGSSVLVRNAFAPVYSPDGTRIAFLRGDYRTVTDEDEEGNGSTTTALMSDLFVKSVAEETVRRLTSTPTVIETDPSWDPSGERIAYTKMPNVFADAGFFGFGDSIVSVNADGTCPTKVLSKRSWALFGATWQPGPGREVGRIAC